VKDASELALIREACDIASASFEETLPSIRAGVTEAVQLAGAGPEERCPATEQHGREVHGMEVTREQAIAQFQPV